MLIMLLRRRGEKQRAAARVKITELTKQVAQISIESRVSRLEIVASFCFVFECNDIKFPDLLLFCVGAEIVRSAVIEVVEKEENLLRSSARSAKSRLKRVASVQAPEFQLAR